MSNRSSSSPRTFRSWGSSCPAPAAYDSVRH